MSTNKRLFTTLAALAFLGLAACDKLAENINNPGTATGTGTGTGTGDPTLPTPTPVPTPDEDGNEPVGVVNDTAGFYVRHVQDDSLYTYVTHKGDATPAVECTATAGEQAFCFLEAKELDLYYNGVTLQYNVPSDMCDYLRFNGYWYYKFAMGRGPDFVRVYRFTTSLGATFQGYNGSAPDSQLQQVASLSCPFDYHLSKPTPGPNCCVGEYTLESWNQNPDQSFNIVTTIVDWGGDASLCIGGPYATHALTPKSASGFPVSIFTYVSGTGLNATYEIPRLIGAPGSAGKGSNVFGANFVKPADHGATADGYSAGLPASLQSPPTLIKATFGDVTNGSNQVTNVAETTNVQLGNYISATGIPLGTTVTAISALIPLVVADGDTTASSTSLTNLSTLTNVVIGQTVTGAGIPSSTRVVDIQTPTVRSTTGTTTAASNQLTTVVDITNVAIGQIVSGAGIVAGTTVTAVASANVLATTGDLSAGSNLITGVAVMAGIVVGQTVTGTDIPTGTTVTAIDMGTSTVTISNNSTGTGVAVPITFVTRTVTMSQNATATASGVALTFQSRTVTLSRAATATAARIQATFNVRTVTMSAAATSTTASTTVSFYGLLGLPTPEHYFRFQCVDRANEIRSEILFQIRDWNSGPEFDAMANDPTQYDLTGNESAPWDTWPKNDFWDWKDWDALTGTNKFPAFSE